MILPLLTSLLVFFAMLLAITSWREVWDSIADRYVADLMPTIEALGIDRAKIPLYLRLWGFSLVFVFCLFAFVLNMPPIAVAFTYLTYIAPRLLLKMTIARRKTLLRDQLAGVCQGLANATRAEPSLRRGLALVASESPEPVAGELRKICTELEGNIPETTAINNAKNRLNLDSFTLMAATIVTFLKHGGPITENLERISHSLQENQRIERKMESETASGRSVLRLLAIFPFLFLLLFMFIFPSGTFEMLNSTIGQVVLFIVLAMIYFSVSWGQRILRFE